MSAGRFVYFRPEGTWPKLQSLPANQNDARYSVKRRFAPNTVLEEHHVSPLEDCRLVVRQEDSGLIHNTSRHSNPQVESFAMHSRFLVWQIMLKSTGARAARPKSVARRGSADSVLTLYMPSNIFTLRDLAQPSWSNFYWELRALQ